MVRLTDLLDMTVAVDWDVKPQTKETKLFVIKMLSAYMSVAYKSALQTTFIMEANNTNPDQQSDLGLYCYQSMFTYEKVDSIYGGKKLREASRL